MRALTQVVGPDLECFLLSHQHADLLVLLVLQQLGLADTSLLPLPAVIVIAVKLGFAALSKNGRSDRPPRNDADLDFAPLKQTVLRLFSRARFDLFQLHKWLEPVMRARIKHGHACMDALQIAHSAWHSSSASPPSASSPSSSSALAAPKAGAAGPIPNVNPPPNPAPAPAPPIAANGLAAGAAAATCRDHHMGLIFVTGFPGTRSLTSGVLVSDIATRYAGFATALRWVPNSTTPFDCVDRENFDGFLTGFVMGSSDPNPR